MMRANDLQSGRNARHQYNITPAEVCFPLEPKLLKSGELAKHQPKRPKPKFNTKSVTRVSGSLPKDGLMWGAAKETATYAVENREWRGMPDEMAIETLRTRFRYLWDIKAETGTIVHEVAMLWAQEKDADIAEMLAFDRYGKERKWTPDETAEVLRRVDGCLISLEKFYKIYKPEWRFVERTVINPGATWRLGMPYKVDTATCYAGQFDAVAYLKGVGWVLLDHKTGQRYLDAMTLQLAGLAHAPLLGTYDAEGHLILTEPFEAPRKRAVVFLNDSGEFEYLELPAGRRAYQRFIALRRNIDWLDEITQFEKDHPSPFNGEEELQKVAA